MRFDAYHPAINLIFFATVVAAAVAFNHPVFLAVGYVCAFAYSVKLNGARAVVFNLVVLVLVALWAAAFSAYTHFGVTTLAINFIGNRITLESVVMGVVTGIQGATVLMWLSCVHAVVSADKVAYLLGRVSPHLSLFVSIVVRMVPRIKDRAGRMNLARHAVGRGSRQGGLLVRARNTVTLASTVITWLTESLVTTSDSMRSRGYLLRGRTAYSLYRFNARDRSVVIALFCFLAVMVAGLLLDQTTILYDPEIVMNRVTPLSAVFYAAYAAFCLTPLALQVAGEVNFARARRAVGGAGAREAGRAEAAAGAGDEGCAEAEGGRAGAQVASLSLRLRKGGR